jgi:arylsulfatase A-like enzyme
MAHSLYRAVAVFCLLLSSTFAAAAERPNILLIVADDLGWKDVGWHGAKIETPHMDELVRTGVELDQHYVQPVCTPTRTALLSGRYPSRFGPHALVPSNLRALPPGTVTLAAALQSVGYETYQCGKWHLGSKLEWGPNHFGFDHSYGSLAGAVDPWQHTYRSGPYEKTWHRDCVRLDEEGNATELVAAEAERRIRERKRPWLVYVPFHAVHIPIDAPPNYKAAYANVVFHEEPAKNESRRRFAAFVSQLDAKIGQLVKALDETDQREDTLIVFTSDNGGLWQGGNAYVSDVPPTPLLSDNAPLRGQKGQLYEGGIRVPAFVNWKGTLTQRKVASPLHAVDWFPTLAGLAGYQPAESLALDGEDAWPLIAGTRTAAEPRTIYWPYNKGRAIRHGDWKLIDFGGGRTELFNLADDPGEANNLTEREPERLAELTKRLATMRESDRLELPEDLVGLPK